MKKNNIYVTAAALLVLGVVTAMFVNQNNKMIEESAPIEQVLSATTFDWRFSAASTNNLDGNPQTDIFLTVTHSGQTVEQQVDTVDGSCSVLEGEGDALATGGVQCYAAGFGQQYRVVGDGYVFFVERKFFEEALPEIDPPVYEWEVVSEFTFS
jgi:hypothetical protein